MKKFKDIKTGTQLIVSFGILIVLMLGLTIIAWVETNKMAEQAENLYNHPYRVMKALGIFEASATAIHRDMRGLMLAENEEEIEELLKQIEFKKAEAYRQLDIIEAQFLGSTAVVSDLRTEFTKWNTMREETIRLLRKGELTKAAERTRSNGTAGAQALKLFGYTAVVHEFAKNKGEEFYNQILKSERDHHKKMLLFSSVTLLISITIAFFLSRLINIPLKEITRAIQSYHTGKKDSRSTYSSNNQFGKLSESFNEMAEVIQSENLIAQRAAQLSDIMLSENDANTFCTDLLRCLLNHTNSQMGAVYLLNKNQSHFECFSCLGMDEEGCNPFSAIHPQGEFGLAMNSQKISHIKEIPSDSRFSFQTVTGSFKPREIITIPIVDDNQTVAIISLFSLHNYPDAGLRLIENLFGTLTARMNGILANKKMIELNQKLEEQNNELDAQKNELGIMANELKEQNAELEIQKLQLGEISRLKSNFLSNMSHELRTPLNSVIALSGVLNRRLAEKIGDEEYSYLKVIERNGKHLLELINDILDLSRIEAGKVELEKTIFNINGLLNDVVSMIEPQAVQKNIKLTLKEEPGNETIESDYYKCYHIFQNIIGNAVKFTEKGTVEIKATVQNGNAKIIITDTGIGIGKGDLPYIFDEFRQADGSNSRRFGGTGLGLSIAGKFAELLGCIIDVESKPGKGSIFTVTIPQKAIYKGQESISITSASMRQLPKSHTKPETGEKTILLVEDTQAMVIQMREVLGAHGYTVDTAYNGIEALEYLEKKTPDALIIDIMMPGMDGIELLNKIRSKELTAELPVLVLTAKILSEEERKQIKNNHIHQLIQKGRVTHDKLLEAVAMMFLKGDENPKTVDNDELITNFVSGKPRVLAVEDNTDNMLALKALLDNRFEFFEAGNGLEGIEKAQIHLPHLILMDIAMPEMNGIEALKRIRENEDLKHIPVIAVTSSAMRGDKNYFIELGFNGYVSKPVNNELLFEEIYKLLKIKKQ
jgi:signal transduction histidine kinase/response regulator RpfG family c-di-GMP phosphodiesterase/HAMP domain-containing protein